MADRATPGGKKRRSFKLPYQRAKTACRDCRKRRIRCKHGQGDSNCIRVDIRTKKPRRRIKRACDSCREKRILCAPKTEDSCGRCNRLQLKDCNFEVKETSQDKPASQRTARPLSILPSVEPEQGTINAWGSGTFATAMASLASQELQMPVTIAAQQNSSVVSGSSFIKRFPAPRLNTVFESAKAGYDDVSEFAEGLAPSGSCLNASLLTVVAPPITRELEFWHCYNMSTVVKSLSDELSGYQLSSMPLSYNAVPGVETFAMKSISLSGVGYPPSRFGDPNGNWQLQQYQKLDE